MLTKTVAKIAPCQAAQRCFPIICVANGRILPPGPKLAGPSIVWRPPDVTRELQFSEEAFDLSRFHCARFIVANASGEQRAKRGCSNAWFAGWGAHRSSGRNPVRFAILASIRGPISSSS